MEFENADPSVVRSIRQRDLLNTWLRAAGKHRPLPLAGDFQPDRVADEMVDMMEYEVVGQGDDARFLITHQGARLADTYGNERVDPTERPNRFLDDAIGPERYASVIELYRACLTHLRPVYSISTVQDADGKDVSYERLLMPFGSIEGGFKISNLMGLRRKAEPVILIRAIISRAFVPTPANAHSPGEIIELD
jgi:hypothetical protein